MGTVAEKVYLDANILIYLLEGAPGLSSALEDIRARIASGAWIAHTGMIAVCEVLVKPVRDRDDRAIAETRHFLLESGAFRLVPTTLDVYVLAAELRAHFNLKLGDAIHAACAIHSACELFVSNDRSIRLPGELQLRPLTPDGA